MHGIKVLMAKNSSGHAVFIHDILNRLILSERREGW
jgi:hypothetical protein